MSMACSSSELSCSIESSGSPGLMDASRLHHHHHRHLINLRHLPANPTAAKRKETAERMRKWRASNAEKNRENDTRCRVYRVAREKFGQDDSPAKAEWIREEITRRTERRRMRDARKGGSSGSSSSGGNGTNRSHSGMSHGAHRSHLSLLTTAYSGAKPSSAAAAASSNLLLLNGRYQSGTANQYSPHNNRFFGGSQGYSYSSSSLSSAASTTTTSPTGETRFDLGRRPVVDPAGMAWLPFDVVSTKSKLTVPSRVNSNQTAASNPTTTGTTNPAGGVPSAKNHLSLTLSPTRSVSSTGKFFELPGLSDPTPFNPVHLPSMEPQSALYSPTVDAANHITNQALSRLNLAGARFLVA